MSSIDDDQVLCILYKNAMEKIKEYVNEELTKYDGIYLPVRAGFLEQLLVKKLSPNKLHPNPNDEFCSPDIGPNDGIIGKYLKQIRFNEQHSMPPFDEPLIIEKMRPDGYMLLNGHHRWAAALMLNLKTVPVEVTNLIHKHDIIGRMEKSSRNKRASINLDDVVFCPNETEPAEKRLIFPFRKFFPERIRLGIPGLVYALQNAGYDVWIYTTGYASTDYLNHLFWYYKIKPDGIINGANRMNSGKDNDWENVKELMARKYRITLNIDMDAVSWIRSETKDFEMIYIDSKDGSWAQQVIAIVRKLKDL